MSDLKRLNNPGFSEEYALKRLQMILESDSEGEDIEAPPAPTAPEEYPVEKDISALMSLELGAFITELYRALLYREPDDTGYMNYMELIFKGASREAVAYSMTTTPEFANRFRVVGLEGYARAYKRFRIKLFIRRIPVIGWFIWLRRLPELLAEFRMMNVRSAERENALNARLEAVEAFVAKRFTELDVSVLNSLETSRTVQRSLNNAVNQSSSLLNRLHTENYTLQRINFNISEKIDHLTALENKHNTNIIRPVVTSHPGGVIVVQTTDFLMGVPSEEWRLASYLSAFGYFELGTETLFKSLLKKDMNVLDIGANLGIFTLHAAKAGCNVYSYEPTPDIFKILKENIQLNGFAESNKVKSHNVAVGEKDGEATFVVYDDVSGHNTMFPNNKDGKKITVKVVSLDSHLPQGTPIDVVKIDVEGAEWLVLNGMKRIIAENPNIKIIMEYAAGHLKRANLDPDKLLSDIAEMGFEIYAIDDFTGELIKKTNDEIIEAPSNNLFLTKQP